MKNTGFVSMLMVVFLILNSCSVKSTNDSREILATEHEFAGMADEKGVAEAFYHFAADSAVILRGGKLIRGKEAIREYYSQHLKPGTKLLWAPDFIDVSGELAYTWGKYTLRIPDSAGNVTGSQGYFHTVWKRQPDGSWRFVWD
ncbi:MAG TPA: DUF4440 domain-containing protein [Bacteroidales bacterium]|nr:DUF4440 domain-containing protein [Bacteroidales bacterium]HPI69246.1 DUF4440 domain-containing protein [Bacteroidales bacterium]HPR12994.1 DUF4440 domain-containing protein [Bacteroidales bacterium]HRW85349.1 DUF4440 domain-containing protein [Bacteroidales bacterium]